MIAKNPVTGDLDDSAKGRSIDVSPDNKVIAVGCKDGTVRVRTIFLVYVISTYQ